MTDNIIENEIKEKNRELEELRDIKLKGSFVRSRSQMFVQDEKPNKIFLNLENNNFISKNIKELIISDNNKINNPDEILEEMRKFYKNLYSWKKIEDLETSIFRDYYHGLPKISDEESSKLDLEININELHRQIFSTQNNKSPGPDGFTNEFFKIFWDQLKFLLLKLLNTFFEKKKIPDNFLLGIITCIPKGNKARNRLKNWRPITLLNSIYKFYSGIWANRIKQFLPKLIGESQKGFVQNRFIGENTVLTLDILNETKLVGDDGLIILVDFEKAFDSISWEYISKTLKQFNFSENLISIIKSLQKNSKSKILQNGHLSETLVLGRGCRQGDPISPYLFVLAVELLGETFRKHQEIDGIIIRGKEHRISQFADDTTLFMKNNEKSLRTSMNILNHFHHISGLKINVEKTKAIKFGMPRDGRINICQDLNLIWTSEFISLGINYNILELENITELNLEPKILEMEKLTSIWRCRNLTLIGKITIIKTLMISKIIHILLSLPKPSEESFIRIENAFKKFLWNEKPPKFKISTLENLTADGGLHFPDIRKIDTVMKASWIKRIYKADGGWSSTPIAYGLDKIYDYGDIFIQKKAGIPNIFWRNVIQSVQYLYMYSNVRGLEHLLSMPLWYNSKMINEKHQSWVDKGLLTIGDLLDDDGDMFTIEYIRGDLGLRCDFLLYNRLKIRIHQVLGNNLISSADNVRPRLPYILYIAETNSKGNKNTYYNVTNTGNMVLNDLQTKWSEKLNDDIRIDTLSNSFKNAKKYSPSVYQHFLQYKLIHRRIVHNTLLFRMGISNTPNCLFCDEPETIEHVYLECPNAVNLWFNTENWVKNLNFPHFKISDNEKIFGEKYNNHLKHIIVISVKDVIYQKRKVGNNMHLADVKRQVLKNLHITKTQELLKNQDTNFDEYWRTIIDCLRIDISTRNSWYYI